MEKAYEPHQHEKSIYQKWEQNGAFRPSEEGKPFIISMPPPNVTGTLHLGHALMLVIEDLMIRYKRLRGFAALWVPGTDHAGIATQSKVEKLLREKEGKSRHDLGRDKFLERVWQFKEESQSTIKSQIRAMGSSCDWSHERFTLDEGLSKAVRHTFVKMYKDGLVYRGYRLVNWCVGCGSSISDDEVEHKELEGSFYYIKYPLADGSGHLEVATTRPETMLGDTAVAVNPADRRYKKLVGKTIILPILGREIPIISDKRIDKEFGTGAVKVTPGHDPNDWEIGCEHDLEKINILNNDGTLNENAGPYADMPAAAARKQIIQDLQDQDLLTKIVPHLHSVGHCYRCNTVIEPKMSEQWFVKVTDADPKKNLKKLTADAVRNGDIKIMPDRFSKIYFQWIDNLRDWCISRQLWWGHRIPVWYCQDCKEIIAENEDPAQCPKCGSKNIRQDEDTLDTWFSSGLWPFSTLGWPDQTADLKRFFPTDILETGYDILFFWVARMIMMSVYCIGQVPFRTVYLHGLICDEKGKKMSKSTGNGIDPLDMVEKYGTDALRISMILGVTPGNNINMSEDKIKGGRNFINKLWNIARFLEIKAATECGIEYNTADRWIISRAKALTEEVTHDLENWRIGEAAGKLYDFTWNEFADYYIEAEKTKSEDKCGIVARRVFKQLLVMLHPFVPFITELLWAELGEKEMLISADWDKFADSFEQYPEAKQFQKIINLIKTARQCRQENGIPAGKKIDLQIKESKQTELVLEQQDVIKLLANLSDIKIIVKKPTQGHLLVVESGYEAYISTAGLVDLAKEHERIQKLIAEKEAFITKLEAKLANKEFTKKAPKPVVQQERERLEKEKEELGKLKK